MIRIPKFFKVVGSALDNLGTDGTFTSFSNGGWL